MKIRYATDKDVPRLAQFIRSIIINTPYYSAKAKKEEIRKYNTPSLKECLRDKKYNVCFVAFDDRGEIIGFALGRNEAGVFWADWVGVDKYNRRKGIAEALVKECERRLRQKGVHKIWCDTRTNNKQSTQLLNKLKYKKLGTFINGWYKQDFFLWEKDLKS